MQAAHLRPPLRLTSLLVSRPELMSLQAYGEVRPMWTWDKGGKSRKKPCDSRIPHISRLGWLESRLVVRSQGPSATDLCPPGWMNRVPEAEGPFLVSFVAAANF